MADPLRRRTTAATAAAGDFPRRFASLVKSQRQALGLTQGQLATALQLCGIQASQGYVSLLEAGQRNDPDIRLVAALAVLLDMSLDPLLQDPSSPGNDPRTS